MYSQTSSPAPHGSSPRKGNLQRVLAILGALVLFLFAIDLMTSSLQHLGKPVAETILLATSNPFTGLFIGLLITAMLQSSSTTTSLTVALVASGSVTLQGAIPIIMGANVGTTITSTIVSLSFINKKKEFRRAVAAGTYHDFFNILTVIVLFPLEYYYDFLSEISSWITNYAFVYNEHEALPSGSSGWTLFDGVTSFLIQRIPSAFALTVIAVVLLFSSILIFRKLISDLLEAKSPEAFSRFFFKSPIKSFGWGIVTTAAIRSSTITTSVVVPIVAKKIATLRQAAPFIMGANVGTTVTAFIAAWINNNTTAAISIAIAHFLFNFFGVCLFFPIPVLKEIPVQLASGLGKLTLKYRLAGFVYLLFTFFFIPFSLIYFNQDSSEKRILTYEKTSGNSVTHYRIAVQMNEHGQYGEWMYYSGKHPVSGESPVLIYPVAFRDNTFYLGKRIFMFKRPGSYWEGNDETGKYTACVERILSGFELGRQRYDSVYVWRVTYANLDSISHTYYMDAQRKYLLLHETTKKKALVSVEKLLKAN